MPAPPPRGRFPLSRLPPPPALLSVLPCRGSVSGRRGSAQLRVSPRDVGWWPVPSRALHPETAPSPASPHVSRLPISLHSLKGRRAAQSSHFAPPCLSCSFSGAKASRLSPALRAFHHPHLRSQHPLCHFPPHTRQPVCLCSLEAPGLCLHSQWPESAGPEKTPVHPSAPSSSDGFPPEMPRPASRMPPLCLSTLCNSGRPLTFSGH